MLTRGKDLHRLCAGTLRELEQPRMQAMFQEYVSRKNAQHLGVAPRAGLS
jgi:hypothetical protein